MYTSNLIKKPALSWGFTFSVVCPCNQVGLKQQAGIIEHIYAVPPSACCAACVILFHNVPDLDWVKQDNKGGKTMKKCKLNK